jgi:hypothetical protein
MPVLRGLVERAARGMNENVVSVMAMLLIGLRIHEPPRRGLMSASCDVRAVTGRSSSVAIVLVSASRSALVVNGQGHAIEFRPRCDPVERIGMEALMVVPLGMEGLRVFQLDFKYSRESPRKPRCQSRFRRNRHFAQQVLHVGRNDPVGRVLLGLHLPVDESHG